MTDRLVLDTHIALWLDNGDDRLTAATRDLIDAIWHAGDNACFSAVSAWEIALLVDTGRFRLDVAAGEWVDRFVSLPGITPVPLSHRAASRSYHLHHFENRDPADRLLIATAIELECALVTYDAAITRFAQEHGRQYGFTVAT